MSPDKMRELFYYVAGLLGKTNEVDLTGYVNAGNIPSKVKVLVKD